MNLLIKLIIIFLIIWNIKKIILKSLSTIISKIFKIQFSIEDFNIKTLSIKNFYMKSLKYVKKNIIN
jgi:hypothetical protein